MISLPIHTDDPKPCVRIRVTAECALHSPDIIAKNDETDEQEFVGRFRGVGLTGQYCFQTPDGYSDFKVADTYGVIEAI